MRIYSKMEHNDQIGNLKLKEMFADYPFVDLCNVTRLLEVHNITRPLFPMTWRFLPLMDPTVDRLLPRDSDSLITAREVDAVHDWITNSSATFHIMRDHWFHCDTQILGGLYLIKSSIKYFVSLTTCRKLTLFRSLGCENSPETAGDFTSV